MDYPKYTRKQNKCCRLTDEQVEYARELYHKSGLPINVIARQLGVSWSAINMIVRPDSEVAQRKRARNKVLTKAWRLRKGRQYFNDALGKCIERKRKLCPTFDEWQKGYHKDYNKNRREEVEG